MGTLGVTLLTLLERDVIARRTVPQTALTPLGVPWSEYQKV